MIADKNWKILKSELSDLEPFQIAEAIGELPKSDRTIPFRLLSRESAKETFKHLSHDQREEIIDGLAAHIDKMTDLLNDLDPDDRTAFFEELPGEVSQRLVQMLSQEEREVAMRLLGYPEDSIGRLMTPEYVAVRPYFTVAQALEHIRRYGRDSETLDVIYVVDEHWKLIDDIRIKEVILASPLVTCRRLPTTVLSRFAPKTIRKWPSAPFRTTIARHCPSSAATAPCWVS